MKKVLIIIVLISSTLHAQYNFKYQNKTLKWQKVFEIKTPPTTLNLFLKNQSITTTLNNNVIEFTISYSLEQLEAHGFKRSKFPVFMNNGNIHGFIEFKDNRYRATVTNIAIEDIFNNNKTDELSTMIYKKNNQLRYPKTSLKLLQIYDAFLQTKLTYKPTNNDW